MAKLTKRKRKELREKELAKAKLQDQLDSYEEKKAEIEIENTLNPFKIGSVSPNNPIILEFYRALKNKKVYGAFSNRYKIIPIDHIEKRRALNSGNRISIGNITIRPNKNDIDFLKRARLITRMISASNYQTSYTNGLTTRKALGCYAEEYFKDKEYLVKHSLTYFQILFGIIYIIVGLSLMFGVIYYFWGGLSLLIIVMLILIFFLVASHILLRS